MADERSKNGETSAGKRKRTGLAEMELATRDQRMARIDELNREIKDLIRYYNLQSQPPPSAVESEEIRAVEQKIENASSAEKTLKVKKKQKKPTLEGLVVMFTEGSSLPLAVLVSHISQHLTCIPAIQATSPAHIRTAVLSLSRRVSYGISDPNADSLEDQSFTALWCWEITEFKLLPKELRPTLKARRMFRKKIQDRICAIYAAIQSLQKSDSDPGYENDIVRALDKLKKVPPVSWSPPLENSKFPETETNRILEEIAQLPKPSGSKSDPINLSDEHTDTKATEKEQKLRAKRELDIQKNVKKQQDEAEKELRKREKEEADARKNSAIKKQASLMERFLKKSKPDTPPLDQTPSSVSPSKSPVKQTTQIIDAATRFMDETLSSQNDMTVLEIRRSHLSSWRIAGNLIRSKRSFHWSIRRKPKSELFTQLKLTTVKDYDTTQENLENMIENTNAPESDAKTLSKRQLLQFDKTCRPAFYGLWPKKSSVIGPRHPFRKDPDIDYEFESEDEWEEEEPGESLSDFDKDDDEEDQRYSKEEEEGSEDDYIVPDGYLSENEGVQVDRIETDAETETNEAKNEEFLTLVKQQKQLNNITQMALRKNQPFVIINLEFEKSPLLVSDEVSGAGNMEKACLQMLSMRFFPNYPPIVIEEGVEKADASTVQTPPLKKCLNEVSVQSPVKIKNRPITDFIGANYQAKKLKLGDSPPVLSGSQHVSAFSSKRCVPPADEFRNA